MSERVYLGPPPIRGLNPPGGAAANAFGVDGGPAPPPSPPPDGPLEANVYTNDHNFNGRYNQYTVDTNYFYDPGIRVLPIMGDPLDTNGPTSAAIRVHNGQTTKVVKWTGERLNNRVALPSTDTGDPNEVLVGATIIPANPYQDIDSVTWRVSGAYQYVCLKPKVPGQNGVFFYAGSTPAETNSAQNNFYGADCFVTNPLANPIGCAPDTDAIVNALVQAVGGAFFIPDMGA